MMLKSRYFAPLLVAAAPTALFGAAPIAIADPTPPRAGTESPTQTISDLKAQGYDVTINWVAGQPDVVPLEQCVVTSIDTSAPPDAYVSINCPPAGSQ